MEAVLTTPIDTFGGLFFFNCNYDVNDYTITSQFYRELLLWWSQFRETFVTDLNWTNIIWNNKEIRVDKKPIYYKKFFDSGITHIHKIRKISFYNGQVFDTQYLIF